MRKNKMRVYPVKILDMSKYDKINVKECCFCGKGFKNIDSCYEIWREDDNHFTIHEACGVQFTKAVLKNGVEF